MIKNDAKIGGFSIMLKKKNSLIFVGNELKNYTVQIQNLGKLLFFSYNWKNFEPIRLQYFFITSLIDFLHID